MHGESALNEESPYQQTSLIHRSPPGASLWNTIFPSLRDRSVLDDYVTFGISSFLMTMLYFRRLTWSFRRLATICDTLS